MKHFDHKFLSGLHSKSNDFHRHLKASVDWVNHNLRMEERQSMMQELNETKSEVFTIHENINTKPVFALFGQSQVGKSYLVKNLLTVDGKSFEIEFPDGTKFDFLQDINPVGQGAEATGVVTRFSLDAKYVNSEFPVRIQLLDAKDIVLILCDSFFSDLVKISNYPNENEFKQHIDKLKSEVLHSPKKQTFFTEDHVFVIKKYFANYFIRSTHYVDAISKSNYWLEVSQLIENCSPDRWVKIFEILWNYQPTFSKLFVKLINGLQSIDFERQVYAPVSAILRTQGKILDVDRVMGIFSSHEAIKIYFAEKINADFDLHLLSALTAEITMPLNPSIGDEKTFLQRTDLLDFPGARSRQQLNLEHINEISMPKNLLRGKVSYLFNKYSSNYEINNLLFCLKNEKNEVGEIPQLLNDWIERNIGDTDVERDKRIGESKSPLFIIFTFYNYSLKFNPNSDLGDLSAKWDNRFIKFFLNETVTTKYNWSDHWTVSNPKFQGFYLLRDFQFSEDVFNGYGETGREIEIIEERKDYMQRMKDSFLSFPFVKNHFADPEYAWSSSSEPNMDGSQRIIEDLLPSANNNIKTKNYIEKLEGYKSSILTSLRKHYHSDDIQIQRSKAAEEGKYIKSKLLNLFPKNKSSFGVFLKKLYVTDTDIYNYIHENYLPASKDHTPSREEVILRTYGLSVNLSMDENRKILKDKQLLSDDTSLDSWLTENDIDLNKVLQNVHVTAASTLVDGVLEIWKSKLDVSHFKDYIDIGLQPKCVQLIAENLIRTFGIFEVRRELIKIFERKTRLMKVSNDTDEYLASIITSYINDFVSNFGFNFMTEERKELVMNLADQYSIDSHLLKAEHRAADREAIQRIFEEDDSSNNLLITFPVIEHYNAFISKVQLIMLSNCGFRDFNVAENEKLKQLMENIEVINFNS